MSTPLSPSSRLSEHPTNIRYWVVLCTALVAVFMYIDRACLSQMKGEIRSELNLEDWEMDWILGSFFLTYALFQVPAGLLSARLGARAALTIYLIGWSLFTAFSGLAQGFLFLMIARLLVGMFEAGAYPTAASLVKAWFPIKSRGKASSGVALGGRAGWAISQFLTPFLIASFISIQFTPWRGVLILYGVLGIGMALVFWLAVRDTPSIHPQVNPAELDLITQGSIYPKIPTPPPLESKNVDALPTPLEKHPSPWAVILQFMADYRMWLFGGTQFCVNIGWAFLITNLPDFLVSQYSIGPELRGTLSAIPPIFSVFGMLIGGILTDALVRKFGLRWGRSVPITFALVMCSAMYLGCMILPNVYLVIVAFGFMALFADLAIPGLWAFAQDIGGKNTAATLGWGNMMGNFGAALSPVLLGAIKRSDWGWNGVFVVCAGCFVFAAFMALGLDAREKNVR